MDDFSDSSRNRSLVPPVGSPEHGALLAFWKVYEPNLNRLNEILMAQVSEMPVWRPILDSMSPEVLAQQQKRSHEILEEGIVRGNWTPYLEDLRTQGVQYARMGIGFREWFKLSELVLAAFIDLVSDRYAEDPVEARRALQGINVYLNLGMGGIGEAYLAAKEEVIAKQQEAIRELSTPVLQVRDRLLVLPIVGAIDTHRARHVTESLLHSIRDRRARAVVIDITGVPVVDSKVASHIVQTVEAGRLMGARVIVSGISPEIAMTMVALGATLPGVATEGDLQAGLEHAIRHIAAVDAAESPEAGPRGVGFAGPER